MGEFSREGVLGIIEQMQTFKEKIFLIISDPRNNHDLPLDTRMKYLNSEIELLYPDCPREVKVCGIKFRKFLNPDYVYEKELCNTKPEHIDPVSDSLYLACPYEVNRCDTKEELLELATRAPLFPDCPYAIRRCIGIGECLLELLDENRISMSEETIDILRERLHFLRTHKFPHTITGWTGIAEARVL